MSPGTAEAALGTYGISTILPAHVAVLQLVELALELGARPGARALAA